MQQHPVPRNITGFQFKLIGDMTLKQFGYLLTGVISGYLFYKLLPLPAIIRIALGLLAGGGGAAFAFLPIQGRPLDIWVRAFFKSVFSPTQYVWRKKNSPPPILAKPVWNSATTQNKTQATEPRQNYHTADAKLSAYLQQLNPKPFRTFKPVPTQSAGAAGQNLPPAPDQSRVKVLSREDATQAGFPKYPPRPNIIAGVILDKQKRQLPGILVTIKSRQGMTVRALKTNQLGQFISSSPLADGEYLIEVEDPRGKYKFDIIKAHLRGKLFAPIEIVAKAEPENKQAAIREKLFKETNTIKPPIA